MPLPLAVADTSVLINLQHLDLLPPLSLLYSSVLVPSPVRTEFLRRDNARAREFALLTLTEQGFFVPCDDYDSIEVELFRTYKMYGAEAEALSQAKARNADILLIDEKIGRKMAMREMRLVKGTASILVEFHKLGLIDFLSAITRLRDELAFRIEDKLVVRLTDGL